MRWSVLCCLLCAACDVTPAQPLPPAKVTTHAEAPTVAAAVRTDWARFLGPAGDLTSPEWPLKLDFTAAGPPLVWEMEVGTGYAAPAIVDGKLIVFDRLGDRERVACVEAETGKSLWTHDYPSAYADRYQFSNGPRSSPIIGDGRVYTHGAEGTLHCFELATGKVLWKQNTSKVYNVPQDFFGVGPTPLLYNNLLILGIGAPKGPCVVALEAATGKEVWRAGSGWRAGYASPTVVTLHEKPRILFFAGGDNSPPTGGLLGIDPSDGRVAFEFAFRSRTYTSVNASNPVVVDNRIFISSSYNTGGVLLEIQADESVREVWRTREFGSHFMTPIVRDGHLYGITGSSKNDTELTCVRWSDGKTLWSEAPSWPTKVIQGGQEREMSMSVFRGSLLGLQEGFLLLGEQGHLAYGQLTPEGYQQQALASLFFANETWTPPVLSNGLLYICQNQPDRMRESGTRLLCYSLR